MNLGGGPYSVYCRGLKGYLPSMKSEIGYLQMSMAMTS